MRAEAGRQRDLKGRAAALGMDHDVDVFDQTARSWWNVARTLDDAMLIWVSTPMVRVSLDASQDVPAIYATDCPADSGLAAFETPLPAFDTAPVGGLALREGARTDIHHDDPVLVDAIAWHLHGTTLDVNLLCHPDRLPHPLHPDQADLVGFLEFSAPLPTLFEESTVVSRSGAPVDGNLGPLAFLSSMWVLMMTPTTADRATVDAQTGRAATEQSPKQGQVTVVDLRPLRQVTQVEDRGQSGRTLTRRHVVRGHWTHQPYGPARSLRRVQWIESYIRGPEGAPLDERTLVYQWRR